MIKLHPKPANEEQTKEVRDAIVLKKNTVQVESKPVRQAGERKKCWWLPSISLSFEVYQSNILRKYQLEESLGRELCRLCDSSLSVQLFVAPSNRMGYSYSSTSSLLTAIIWAPLFEISQLEPSKVRKCTNPVASAAIPSSPMPVLLPSW